MSIRLQGVRKRPEYTRRSRSTSEVQGVVFSMNGYHFNGSKVDRRFSYSKIDAALQHNRCRERMGITAGIYETATPSAPSGTAQSINIKGKVTDGKEPIIGATISVEGSNRNAVTDIDGRQGKVGGQGKEARSGGKRRSGR